MTVPAATELVVGLGTPGCAGWRRVLEQEGLAHRAEDVTSTPVVVLAGEVPAWVEPYVAAGGVAVLVGAPDEPAVLPPSIDAVISGFRAPGTGRDCAAPTLARLFAGEGAGTCRLHERRLVKDGMDPGRFPLVLRRRIGKGWLLFSGVPLSRLLMAHGDTLRRFSPHTEVTERVASVDKAEVADTLVWLLRAAFTAAGLPSVSPARFPDGAASVLVLRVDVDGAFGDRTAALVEVADACDVPLSIFVNRQLCDRHPGVLEDWSARHEVGQHGAVHNLFDTVEENLENLRAGASWLQRRTGVVATSFVAPRGMWNPSLGAALAQLGYRYSADFGLEFDSLPFRVPGSGILQIPVHPYSPERAAVFAREEGLPAPDAGTVTAHYLTVLDQQVRANRQAHLYGHPEVLGAMAAEVLPRVVAAARDRGVRAMTLAELTGWWERREAAGVRARWDGDRSAVAVEYAGEPLPVVVEGGQTLAVRLAGSAHTVPAGAPALLRPDRP